MNCPKCNAKQDDKNKFCEKCGVNISEAKSKQETSTKASQVPVVSDQSLSKTVKIYGAVALLVILCLLGSTVYYSGLNTEKDTQIKDLKAEKSDLQGRLVSAGQKIDSLENENVGLQAATQLGAYIGEKFTELDAILLKTDKNSLDAIEWFTDNGLFADPNQANYVYGRWKAVQEETDQEYNQLILEISQLFDDLGITES